MTLLPTCCTVSFLCLYTTATAAVTKIKEKNRLRFYFHSNINESLSDEDPFTLLAIASADIAKSVQSTCLFYHRLGYRYRSDLSVNGPEYK